MCLFFICFLKYMLACFIRDLMCVWSRAQTPPGSLSWVWAEPRTTNTYEKITHERLGFKSACHLLVGWVFRISPRLCLRRWLLEAPISVQRPIPPANGKRFQTIFFSETPGPKADRIFFGTRDATTRTPFFGMCFLGFVFRQLVQPNTNERPTKFHEFW